MLRVGVVGYGTGGRQFHTPFIDAAKNSKLAGIVARAPATVAAAKADWPDTPIYASLAEMIAAGTCDAATITTPPPDTARTGARSNSCWFACDR